MNKYLIKHANEHIKRCNVASQKDSEAMFRAAFLAIGSIRMRSDRFWGKVVVPAYTEYMLTGSLWHVGQLIPDFTAMKFKRDALEHFGRNKNIIYQVCLNTDSRNLFYYLVNTVPGLGPVKAGFIVQLVKGKLGCIDTVNSKRYNLNKIPESPDKYLELLDNIGETSAAMWRNWINYVAKRDRMIPIKLSEAHALFIETGTYSMSSLYLQQSLEL